MNEIAARVSAILAQPPSIRRARAIATICNEILIERERNLRERVAALERRLGIKPSVGHRTANQKKYHARKARMLKAGGTHSRADIQRQLRSQGGKCWWCLKPVGEKYHVDHRIPVSRGGTNNADNLVVACKRCNLKKKDRLPYEWCGRLL